MRKLIYFLMFCFVFIFLNVSPIWAEDYQEVFKQANDSVVKGDIETAIVLYERTIKLNPSFAPAYNNLGLLYREAGLDPVEIAWYFKSAIDIDPKFEDAYINLGKAYYSLNYFDLAERYTIKALELNPSSQQAKLSLAWIYLLGRARPQQALGYFKEIAEVAQLPSSYFGLGMCYLMTGESPRALECITKLRAMEQDSLAIQLEELVRGYENAPKMQDRPLPEGESTEEDFLGQSAPPGASLRVGGPTQITVTGTIPVQIRGKLVNDPPAAPEKPKSGVLMKR